MATPESKIAAKVEQKPNAKTTETNFEAKPAPATKGKTTPDLTPQIAARAYELYEREGHRDGQSVQNWDKAEREIRATQAKAESIAERKPTAKAESEPEARTQPDPDANSKPDARVEPTPATKSESKPETKPDAKSETTPETKPEAKTESAPEVKAPATPEAKAVPSCPAKEEPQPDTKTIIKPADKVEPKPDGKADTKPERSVKPAVEVSPQLVNRVHKLYEQLGRQDVRAVLESEEAESKK